MLARRHLILGLLGAAALALQAMPAAAQVKWDLSTVWPETELPHPERAPLRRRGQEGDGRRRRDHRQIRRPARLQGAGASARRPRRPGADGRHPQHPADRRRAAARHRGHPVPGRQRRRAQGPAQVPEGRVREGRREEQSEDALHRALADPVSASQGEGRTRSTASRASRCACRTRMPPTWSTPSGCRRHPDPLGRDHPGARLGRRRPASRPRRCRASTASSGSSSNTSIRRTTSGRRRSSPSISTSGRS